MEFHQNLQTHSYDCYPAGVSSKHCLLPLFSFETDLHIFVNLSVVSRACFE